MSEEEREKRNAYHRDYYALHLEEQRKRQIEKYHRNKKKLEELDEEKKAHIRKINRLNYEKWKIRQGPKRKYTKSSVVSVKEVPKITIKRVPTNKLKTQDSMKKFKLPSRITTKYVIEVLRNYPDNRLWDLLVKKWTLADFMEFEELEKQFKELK